MVLATIKKLSVVTRPSCLSCCRAPTPAPRAGKAVRICPLTDSPPSPSCCFSYFNLLVGFLPVIPRHVCRKLICARRALPIVLLRSRSSYSGLPRARRACRTLGKSCELVPIFLLSLPTFCHALVKPSRYKTLFKLE